MTGTVEVRITELRLVPGGCRAKAEVQMFSPSTKRNYDCAVQEIDLTPEENNALDDLKAKISERVLRDFKEATHV